MKKSISRFALLAIVGSILCSAFVVGCGGGEPADDTATPAAGADKTEKAAGGAEGDGS